MAAYTIVAANVLPSAAAQYAPDRLAGAAITAGQAVYLDSNNRWQLSDANAASPANDVDGIAVNSAPAAGLPLKVCVYDPSFKFGTALTAGDVIIVDGSAAGGLAPVEDLTTGWVPLVVGVCTTAATGIGVLNCGAQGLKSALAHG